MVIVKCSQSTMMIALFVLTERKNTICRWVPKGRKTIENVNRLSRETLSYGKTVAWPLAIAESDARLLKRSGIDCSGLLVRKDECFAFLNEKIADFDFQHDADYEIEEEAVAYEDELVLESEDLFESEDKK